ncbi:MAG: hypothetical protein NTW21_19805 [Verrucomicrobia bacterium]|nr:hypothetical protein [Verrucomicrobiota bacterium]
MPADNEEGQRITFHLIKGPDFRTTRAHGAIGSLGPGGLNLAFYVERGPIPQTVTHALNEDGSLGEIVDVTGKQGIIREIQSGISMDVDAARDLIEQLTRLLSQTEKDTE